MLKRRETVAIVPAHWPVEIVNVLHQSFRRGRISPDAIDDFLALLQRLPMHVDRMAEIPGMPTVIKVAQDYQQTGYDSAYLELARRYELPLATLDNTMKRAAEAMHIELL